MKKIFLFIPVIIILISSNSAQAVVISRDLKKGDRGADIRQLQVLLNSSPDTKIAEAGSGSPGQETDYFGLLTEKAVKKLQEKYKNDILMPQKQILGSGRVDIWTRIKLIQLELARLQPVSAPVQATSPLGFTITPELQAILDAPRPDAGVVVSPVNVNNNGIAGEFGRQPNRSETMSVAGISPESGRAGTRISISGVGFLPTGNIVHTGYGQESNVSSTDGKTINIAINPPFNLVPPKASVEGVTFSDSSLPLWIYVENKTGISNPAVFYLESNPQ